MVIGLRQRLDRLWRWSRSPQGIRFTLLLGLALLVRLPLATFPGLFHDVYIFVQWGVYLQHHFLDFYSPQPSANAIPDYPPLAMYLFGFLTGVYRLLGGHLSGAYPGTVLFHSPLFAAWMKFPVILADLGAVSLIYAVARDRLPEGWALAAAGAYAFAPAILLGGPFWGQIEPLYALALLAALVFTLRHQSILAGCLFGAAIMLKPQPIVFAPVILVYLWRWAGWRQAVRALGGIAGTCVVICAPYLVPPHPQMLAFYSDVNAWLQVQPQASISAYNLWWLLGAQNHDSRTPYLGPITPSMLGWILFSVVMLVVLAGIWRSSSPEMLLWGTGLLALAFFDVTTLQRERYLYPALALFLVAAIYDKKGAVVYVISSTTLFINQALVALLHLQSYNGGAGTGGWATFLNKHLFGIDSGGWATVLQQYVPSMVSGANVLLLLSAIGIYLAALRQAKAADVRTSGILAPSRPPLPVLSAAAGG